MAMHVDTLVVGEFQANCFVVRGDGNEVLVIDPGGSADSIAHFLEKNKVTVAVYLLTHGHMDHVSALGALYDRRAAPVGIHGDDLAWTFSEVNQMLPFYTTPKRPAEVARVLEDNQEWTDAGLTYRILATPGHTPGSVCFYFPREGTVFTGDTLFSGSVGRTDLPGGDDRRLTASLKKLASLPPETIVYTGHGPATDIRTEKRTNYFMQRA